MMSICRNCGRPTDLALSDIITENQIKRLMRNKKFYDIPLVGVCGKDECTEKVVNQLIDTE